MGTHKVMPSYDGCPIRKTLFEGTYGECVAWIGKLSDKKYRKLVNGKSDIIMVDVRTGRACSFVVK